MSVLCQKQTLILPMCRPASTPRPLPCSAAAIFPGGIALPRIEAVAAAAVMMLASSLFVGEADHAAFSQRIIQGVPNRSATMPKRSAKKVSPIGMRIVPPSAKALKMRSASAAVSTPTVTEKPLG